jgi:hypothetical protein
MASYQDHNGAIGFALVQIPGREVKPTLGLMYILKESTSEIVIIIIIVLILPSFKMYLSPRVGFTSLLGICRSTKPIAPL